MVRNLIRNQAPGNRLRVRIPCPPLRELAITGENRLFCFLFSGELPSCVFPACSLRAPCGVGFITRFFALLRRNLRRIYRKLGGLLEVFVSDKQHSVLWPLLRYCPTNYKRRA